MSDLNKSHGKMSDFFSFPMVGFTSVFKLKSFGFESHWNTLTFCDKKRYGVRFDYVWKNLWSFPLFGFTLVVKLRNFDFEIHWNTLIFFDQKKNAMFEYVLPNSVWRMIWFKLRFFE